MNIDPPGGSQVRVLDAILNRLSEALRTVEDDLRFRCSIPVLSGRWKALRRRVGDLRGDLEKEGQPLSLLRDVRSDPGRWAGDSGHHQRPGDLIAANIARAREASRSLEEQLRRFSLDLAGRAQQLRYGIYEAEAISVGFLRRQPRLAQRRLYLLVSEALCRGPIIDTTIAAMEGGASIVQLREKTMAHGALLTLARQLREITAERDALLIINDHIDIAALCQADGVHLGQEDIAPAEARKILGGDAIIGLSTHCQEQAKNAALQGADYIGVGPIFPTETKIHRAAVGCGYIEAALAASELPGFAIGGVNADTIAEVIAAGARRVAVCTGIIAQEDPRAACAVIRERLVRAMPVSSSS